LQPCGSNCRKEGTLRTGREKKTDSQEYEEGRDGKGEGINRKTRKNERKKTEIKQF